MVNKVNAFFKEELEKLSLEAEKTFLAGAQWRVLRALSMIAQANPKLGINQKMVYEILHPSKLTQFVFPVQFKNKTYLCLGVRAWFDNGEIHKPGEIVKGGIRFLSAPEQVIGNVLTIKDEKKAYDLMLDDVMALGLEMLAKNSGTFFVKNVLEDGNYIKKYKKLANLGLAGGSKGVIVAPRSSRLPDHNEFVRQALEVFGYKLGQAGVIGWDRDVPAGDIGTTGTINGCSVLDGLVDGYQKALNDLKQKMPKNLVMASVTGKTADKKYLGNPDRGVATGFGTVEALKVWSETRGKKITDLIVVFDGAGNAALPAAKFLINSGIRVAGLTDSRSVIMKKTGFSAEELSEITQVKAKRGSLADWAKTKKGVEILQDKLKLWKKSGMNVLFISSDAMIINKNNVDLLPEKILIVDGANGPVTPLAEIKLAAKKIDHLTGSFANSGGVIGSLVEWAANVANISLVKGRALADISRSIRGNFKQMDKLVKNGQTESLADAFYYRAMEKYVKDWLVK